MAERRGVPQAMRRILALLLVALSACHSAQPRVLPRGPAGAEGGLVSVAAGTYASGGGIVDLTYVADPASNLCFASTHVIQGGVGGPGGVVDVDCCALRHVAEVAAALPRPRDHLPCRPGASRRTTSRRAVGASTLTAVSRPGCRARRRRT
jgi:hypothetical protein